MVPVEDLNDTCSFCAIRTSHLIRPSPENNTIFFDLVEINQGDPSPYGDEDGYFNASETGIYIFFISIRGLYDSVVYLKCWLLFYHQYCKILLYFFILLIFVWTVWCPTQWLYPNQLPGGTQQQHWGHVLVTCIPGRYCQHGTQTTLAR